MLGADIFPHPLSCNSGWESLLQNVFHCGANVRISTAEEDIYIFVQISVYEIFFILFNTTWNFK